MTSRIPILDPARIATSPRDPPATEVFRLSLPPLPPPLSLALSLSIFLPLAVITPRMLERKMVAPATMATMGSRIWRIRPPRPVNQPVPSPPPPRSSPPLPFSPAICPGGGPILVFGIALYVQIGCATLYGNGISRIPFVPHAPPRWYLRWFFRSPPPPFPRALVTPDVESNGAGSGCGGERRAFARRDVIELTARQNPSPTIIDETIDRVYLDHRFASQCLFSSTMTFNNTLILEFLSSYSINRGRLSPDDYPRRDKSARRHFQ